MSSPHRWLERLSRVTSSTFFRDAVWIFVLNVISKGFLLFGMANAARSLGPVNLGISAQIQVLAQQLALAFNGGIDSAGVRVVAANKDSALPTLITAIAFRFSVSLVLALGWITVVVAVFEAGPLRNAWLWGTGLIFIAGLNTSFIYQGIGRFPLYSAIGSVGTILTAAAFLFLFSPGIRVGADLIVMTTVSGTAAIVAFLCCKTLVGADRISFRLMKQWVASNAVATLLLSGWRYWLLAVVTYVYAGVPLLLVSHFHGDAATGVFRAAMLMASAIELLFGSINNLLLPKLVTWGQESVQSLWTKQSQLLPLHLAIGLGAGFVCMYLAPYFFTRFLGSQYGASIALFQIMAAARVVVFVGQIYAFGMIALHMDSWFLRATLIGAAVSLAANLAVIPEFGAMGAAAVGLLVELVICVQYYFLEKQHVLARLR